MSQAIHYINQDSKTTAIPKRAVNIVIKEVLDKAALLTALDKALSFPDYFAHNWDSAWDCLTDSDAKHLRLDLTDVKQINTEDFNVFKSMIEDAFRDFGRPQLWVVV
ncbi:barstar family protein [Psychrobacter sp. DM8]|uniref:barstar family protein n=1 Tax=unclassified Psychrobacter TaxID=196806 RepID=UPI003F4F42CA